MTSDHRDDDDEIDLSELIAAVRPSLFPAAVIGLICGIAGLAYAMTLEKQYLATAQFADTSSSKSRSMPSLGGALSGFLPSGGGSNEAQMASDKIMARDFIEGLLETTDIGTDPYFTGENRTGIVGQLKALFIDVKPPTPDAIQEKIVSTFRKVVTVNVRDNGVIDLQVQHTDPKIAANLANSIMETHIETVENKRTKADQQQVDLTKARLLQVQKDLNAAQEKASLYAMQNSIRSMEELGTNSLKLTSFRKELQTLEAILAGIDYLQIRRLSSSSDTIDANEFFDLHPLAFSSLQRRFSWPVNSETLPLPFGEELTKQRQALISERTQIQRTIRVIEAEAELNAEAAGRLAELKREIEVNKTVYAALVSQSEARALNAKLEQESRLEKIQTATPPLSPTSPRVGRIGIFMALLGAFATIGWRFWGTFREGTLHTANSIAHAFHTAPIAEGVGKALGTKRKPLARLVRQVGGVKNAGLLDLTLALSDEGAKKIMILGCPRKPVVHNLAAMLGSGIADDSNRVAIIDLVKSNPSAVEHPTHSKGYLEAEESAAQITRFKWVERLAGDEKVKPFEEALKEIFVSYDDAIMISAPLGQGLLRNRIALNHADHVVILTAKGETTQSEAEWVKKTLSHTKDTKTDIVIV